MAGERRSTRPEGEALRLFFALWPDDITREAIAAHRQSVGRPVPARNWHVTLAFLGKVARERLEPLTGAAAELSAGRCTLTLDRLGHWRRVAVTWLGASGTPTALADLHGQLTARIAGLRLPVEERPFRPHLTLARRAPPRPTETIPPIHWPVAEFCLMASTTRPEGAEYRVLERWPLTA